MLCFTFGTTPNDVVVSQWAVAVGDDPYNVELRGSDSVLSDVVPDTITSGEHMTEVLDALASLAEQAESMRTSLLATLEIEEV